MFACGFFDENTFLTDCGAPRIKPRVIVRRSDFASQEAYELALRTALSGEIRADLPAKPRPIPKPTKFAVRLPPEMEKESKSREAELIRMFVQAIESDYGRN